jgi:hypothetical protein
MTEFSVPRGIIINGREQNGRTYRRDDATYESLDLKDVREGEMVTVVTGEGAQDLLKTGGGGEHDSALDNWKMGPRAVRLALGEPTGNGTAFIHYGIVLKEGLDLQVHYPDSDRPYVVHSLGAIVTIASLKSAEEVAARQADRGELGEISFLR